MKSVSFEFLQASANFISNSLMMVSLVSHAYVSFKMMLHGLMLNYSIDVIDPTGLSFFF